jgi:SulP family sulfate permease
MKPKKNRIRTTKNLLPNILAALATSFVVLSLGAAFGIMSGRGVFIGIISSALIPIVASFLSGSRIQCSGPTGPVTVITAGLVGVAASSGLPDSFINFTLLLSAVFVFLFGVFRLGNWIKFIPNVVISGFMTGIGFIIALSQFQILQTTWQQTPAIFTTTAIVVVLATVCMFVFPRLVKKYLPPKAQFLSGTLLTIITITGLSHLLDLDLPTVSLNIEQNIGSIAQFIQPIWSTNFLTTKTLWLAIFWALQLAFVMSLDTLMTSVVMDRMTGDTTKRNQELFCQSVSTGLISFIGGIPGSQATVRSVLILKEGATGRIASFLVGVFVLLQLFFFQGLLERIPKAVFIGVVLKIAYDIVDWKPLQLYWREIFSSQSPIKIFPLDEGELKGEQLRKNLKNFASRHNQDKIYVTNREIFFILGTAILTLISNLIIAVVAFTVLYQLGNHSIWKQNPIRDLQPTTETEGFEDED